MERVHGTAIPVGKEVFGALPRVLAAVGSGVAAIVIIGGALWSAARYLRNREAPGSGRMAAANGLIALGTLVLSSGGLVQGLVGHDEAFVLSLSVGISVVYGGFVLASGRRLRLGAPDVTGGDGDAAVAHDPRGPMSARSNSHSE
jgi:hypothetical protein